MSHKSVISDLVMLKMLHPYGVLIGLLRFCLIVPLRKFEQAASLAPCVATSKTSVMYSRTIVGVGSSNVHIHPLNLGTQSPFAATDGFAKCIPPFAPARSMPMGAQWWSRS